MVVKNLMVRAGADFSDLSKGTRKGIASINNFKKSTMSIMKGVGLLLAGLEIKKILEDSVSAYDDAIQQETKLATIMKQRMNAGEKSVKSIEDLTMAQQQLGVIEDDTQMAGAQMLATFLHTDASLKTLIPSMNDLAAQQMGVAVTSDGMINIAKLMGRVIDGNVGALKRVGISFTNAQEKALKYGTEEQKAAMLAQVITDNVGHMNAALANTPQGRLQQMRNSFMNLKKEIGQSIVALRDAFVPILQGAINVAIGAVQRLQQVFSYVALFLNTLFGNTANSQISTTAQSTDDAANAANGLADSYDAAGKAAKKSVAGFDEVNTLTQDTSGAASATTPAAGTGVTPVDITGLSNIKDKIAEIATNLRSGFKKIQDAVQPIITTVGDSIKNFYNNILIPLGQWIISDVIPAFFNLLSGALTLLNPILQVFNPLAGWLWDNFLKPILTWSGEVFVASLNNIATALSTIGDWMSKNQVTVDAIVISVAAFFALWKVTELLAFIEISGGIIKAIDGIRVAVMAGTVAKLADKAETIALTALYAKDFVVSVIAGTGALISNAAAWVSNTTVKVVSTVATWAAVAGQIALTVATGAWNIICAIGTALTTAFGVAIAILTSPITLVIAAIVALVAGVYLLIKHWDDVKKAASIAWDWIVNAWKDASTWININVVQPVAKFFTGLWDGIKTAAGGAWEGLKDAWKGAADWINEKVVKPVGKFFSDLWDGIKTTASNSWDSIWGTIKGIVNFIIDGINSMIRGLNSIKLDIPDWIPVIGGKKFGFSIPQIPKLATGGITNGPMVAMIGDNPGGHEVVSPLDRLQDIIASAVGTAVMSAMQFSQGQDTGNREFVMNIDSTRFARVILPALIKEADRTGVTILQGV